MHTDTHTHARASNLTLAFCSFANAPKILQYSLSKYWRHIGWAEVELHSFLTSGPNGGELSTTGSGRFTPAKEHRYPLNRRLGGPQSWLNALEKRKTLLHTLIRTPHRPSCSLLGVVWLRVSVKWNTNLEPISVCFVTLRLFQHSSCTCIFFQSYKMSTLNLNCFMYSWKVTGRWLNWECSSKEAISLRN